MFSEATSFNQDIGSWDVGNGTNFQLMLNRASAFNQNLTGWCVTNITTVPISFNKEEKFTKPTNLFGELVQIRHILFSQFSYF